MQDHSGSKSKGQTEVCNICFEYVKSPLLTKCNHMFCEVCLDQWLRIQFQRVHTTTCPMCRHPLPYNMTIPIAGGLEEVNDMNLMENGLHDDYEDEIEDGMHVSEESIIEVSGLQLTSAEVQFFREIVAWYDGILSQQLTS